MAALQDPITRILWTFLPAAIAFGLSFLPERFKVHTPLSEEQTWGCRAVSFVLAFVSGGSLLWLAADLRPLRGVGRGSPWPLELLLFLSQVFYLAPAVLVLRLHGRPWLRSVGLTRSRALSLGASAVASYFLFVFLWSALRYFGRKDWSTLYTNYLFGDLLHRVPLLHLLVLVTLAATSACVEEIIFRGLALVPISRVIGSVGGITATAVFWSLGHSAGLPRTVGIFLLGLLLGWMFYRTGSLVPSLAFHVLWNLGAMSDSVFGRLRAAGIQWTNEQHFLYIGLDSLIVAFAALLVAHFARRRPQVRRQ